MKTILAMDISSTAIGVCLMQYGDPVQVWSYELKGALYQRIAAAHDRGLAFADHWGDGALAIEAPAYSRYEHVALQRVTGAVLAAWIGRRPGSPIVEIAPNTAKKALTGQGNADKTTMMRLAAIMVPDADVWTDHAADAVGVALAAYAKLRDNAL